MAALASSSDLASFLGETFTEEEEARADVLLGMASELARGYTNQTIDLVEDDEVVLHGSRSGVLYLPQLPVVDVSSIEIDGIPLVVDTDYVWSPSGRLDRVDGVWGWRLGRVAVTYSHGYETIPDDIKAVVLTMASRSVENPSGIAREQVGSYSVSYAQGAFNQGAGVFLTDADRAALDRYRVPVIA